MERLTVTERLRQVDPLVADGLLALATFAFTVGGTMLWVKGARHGPGGEALPDVVQPWGALLAAAACAPLAWRRRAPIVTLALVAAA